MTPAAATSISRAASAFAVASRWRDLRVGLALAMLAAAGCHLPGKAPAHAQSPAGTWHVMEAGETLAAVAQSADVPLADLLEINGLTDPAEARTGRLIYVLASPR